MKTIEYTLERESVTGYKPHALTVEYTISPHVPATRIDPAEGNELEIFSIKLGKHEISDNQLTDAEYCEIETHIYENDDGYPDGYDEKDWS